MGESKQISADLESIKKNEAKEEGLKDFFTIRDKSKRGTSGLVEDAKEIVNNESAIKESLYNKSLTINSIPDYIKPLFSGIFLTAKRNKISENGVFLPTASYGKGTDTDLDVDFSEKQIVLACGPHAQQVAEGMEVVINIENFKKRLESTMAQKVNKEFEYELPIETIEGVEYLYISERDVKYISNTNGKSIPQKQN